MAETNFRQPNGAAMRRLLARHACDAAGVVLRLAWCAGLTREEISSLRWQDVDFDGAALRAGGRTVPAEEEMLSCLAAWRTLCAGAEFVAYSPVRHTHFAPQSISRLARNALDEEGQNGVRMEDLRFDYVRRMLQTHDWAYALRISGVSVTTYRNTPALLAAAEQSKSLLPPPRDAEGEQFRLWQLLQSERASPAGIALWLSTQAGLRANEIISLTWDCVAEDCLHLPQRDVPLSAATAQVLAAARRLRTEGDDAHVILTPRTRKPLTAARLSTMVRALLVRGGVEEGSLRLLRKDTAQAEQRRRLEQYAARHGSVSRGEAAALLGVSPGVAYDRLSDLAFNGVLVRVNARYYPAGSVIAPERQEEAIRAFLEKWGAAYCQDMADMLHLGKRTTARILKRMVERGDLVLLRREKRYTLPKNSA